MRYINVESRGLVFAAMVSKHTHGMNGHPMNDFFICFVLLERQQLSFMRTRLLWAAHQLLMSSAGILSFCVTNLPIDLGPMLFSSASLLINVTFL